MTDSEWMERALALAKRGKGHTAPNPTVGAVLVRDGVVVGEGYHTAAGQPHAEIEALRAAGDQARGATLYVTLEPCCHHGRTPPCTEAILAAGVARVVIGTGDPNPAVAGQGIAQLRAAGVAVEVGVLEAQCRRINQPFFVRVTMGLPLATLKMALSLDGKLATRSGRSRWITGEAARADAHRLRAEADAVLVGARTALLDDPLLTCRLDAPVRQPLRVVLDGAGRLPPTGALAMSARDYPTVVYTSGASPIHWRHALTARGVHVETMPPGPRGLALRPVLKHLAALGVNEVLVEGGQQVLSSFLSEGLAHRLVAYIAPVIIGGADAPVPFTQPAAETMEQVLRLRAVEIARLGDDARIEGWLVDPV